MQNKNLFQRTLIRAKAQNNFTKSPLLAIIILGFVLRVFNINQSLWLDEATSVMAAKNFSFVEIITKFSPGDFHPPLYYLLLKVWGSIFGWSEIAVRSMSVLFGMGTIGLIYKIGSKLINEKVGLIGALLLSIAPLHVYYSQEARMYVPETFFVTLFVWYVLQIFEFGKNKWIALTISALAILYIDYLPYLIFPAILIYLLTHKKEEVKNHKSKLVKVGSFMFLAAVLWFPIFISQIKTAMLAKTNASAWIEILGGTSLKQIILIPIKFLIGRISFYNKVFYAGFILSAVLVYVLPFISSIKKKKEIDIIWLWFLVPILVTIILGFQLSVLSYFRLIFVLPAFYLLVSYGLTLIRNKEIARLLLILMVFINLISIGIYHFKDRFKREDWKSAVSYVEKNSQGQKAVSIFVTKNQRDPYLYYSQNVLSASGRDFDNNMYDKVWLFRYVQPIFDPTDSTRKKIELLGFKKVDEKDFNGVTVWEYRK